MTRGAWGRWWVKRSREEQVMESKAGQSVFNWLCRLEGQRSRAQHGAVTLHYSQWPHNESPCNQVLTDQSFKTHIHAHTAGSNQIPCSLICLSLGSNLTHMYMCNFFSYRFIVPEVWVGVMFRQQGRQVESSEKQISSHSNETASGGNWISRLSNRCHKITLGI